MLLNYNKHCLTEMVDKASALKTLHGIAKKAKSAWQADGKTEEDIEQMISETIQEIRSSS